MQCMVHVKRAGRTGVIDCAHFQGAPCPESRPLLVL